MQDIYKSTSIGVIDHTICLILHYFYERTWGNIKWGIVSEGEVATIGETQNEDGILTTVV